MSLFESFNLGNGFKKYFTIEQAHDPSGLDAVFRLRDEVFREDLGGDAPTRDAFDAASLHCLIRDNKTPRQAIGCARLTLGERLPEGTALPCEVALRSAPEAPQGILALPDRKRCGEISMLAVHRSHRRRRGETSVPFSIQNEDFAMQRQPRFPFVPIGLFLGALSLAADRGLETLLMRASPRLATHLDKLGVAMNALEPEGPPDQAAIALQIDVATNVAAMPLLLQPVWEVVRQEMRRTPLA